MNYKPPVSTQLRYLTALELESRAEISLADMECDDYLAHIKSLSDTISQFRDINSYMKSVHESDLAEKSRLQDQWLKLQDQLLNFQELILSLTYEVGSLNKELAKRNDHNNRHNKQSFGKSSLRSGICEESRPSREEEKCDYSTQDSLAKKAFWFVETDRSTICLTTDMTAVMI